MSDSFRAVIRMAVFSMTIFGLYGCASKGIESVTGAPVTNVFETFKRGEALLNCDTSCSGAWGAASREARQLYDQRSWLLLVNKVARVGYGSDQTYFYLARAAEGLGYYSAARKYYNFAMVSFKCGGFVDVCDGFVFPRDIVTGLNGLPDFSESPKTSMSSVKNMVPSVQGHVSIATSNKIEPNLNLDDSEVRPVSMDQWSSLMHAANEKKTTDWIALKSVDIATKGAKTLNGGKRKQGLELALQSTVLAAYYLELNKDTKSEKMNELQSAHEEQKKNLIVNGVSDSIFYESLRNLKVILPSEKIKKSVIEKKNELKIRKASGSEIAMLNRATKLRLVDPDSAKFGGHVVVGEKSACVMVNAKNRMGGYSGMSAIYLEKLDGTWFSIHDMGGLEMCLRSIQHMKSI